MVSKAFYPLTTLPTQNEQTGASSLTVTGSGVSREYGDFMPAHRGILFLDVSAASGTTPSLTVTLQQRNPLTDKWHDVVAFPAQTAATGATPIAPLTTELYAQFYRLSWVVTGTTPSFTFSCGITASAGDIL